MSNTALPFGVTYNGTSLMTTVSGQRRLMITCARGLDDTPEVRGTDTIIPGQSWREARSKVYDRRIIELRGWVYGVGATDDAQRDDVRDALEMLRSLFDPTNAAASLVVALEDGVRTATISARPTNMLTLVTDLPPIAREVSIELEAFANWVIS